jgi:hypothetical protein
MLESAVNSTFEKPNAVKFVEEALEVRFINALLRNGEVFAVR